MQIPLLCAFYQNVDSQQVPQDVTHWDVKTLESNAYKNTYVSQAMNGKFTSQYVQPVKQKQKYAKQDSAGIRSTDNCNPDFKWTEKSAGK